ncbi:DUF4435 domain-containing protein [Paenibacillus rhizoplanae]|uniref:DUF4435 domain-containing protein n=1 Tax=Paenibacillus rhizoplanae TaxID=1917181 RepID=UPI003621B171
MYIFPPRIDNDAFELEDFNSIVLLGANGSGKTRFSVWIENNWENVHRISAQKSLNIPREVSTKSKGVALEEFYYGNTNENKDWLKRDGKQQVRWGGNPNNFLLNDYLHLLTLLHTEEYEASVAFKDSYQEGKSIVKPTTKLDIVQNIWEEIFPHRKLVKLAGRIDTYPTDSPDNKYNSSEMSDGERLVFYFIGVVVCAPDSAIIIIDEPENHLHKSIIKNLWDKIESIRKDCKFIYLTHEIDFAVSRNNSNLIWIKFYEGSDRWSYEQMTDNDNLPSDVYFEILGSRKSVLFIEGEKSSHDYYVYMQIYPEYNVVPLGSCEKVIEATKAFNSLIHLHHLSAKGIIDRDRKTDNELNAYKDNFVYTPNVAEIENIFLIEDVVRTVAMILRKNPEEVFDETEKRVIELFKSNIHDQAYQHAIYQIKTRTNHLINIKYDDFQNFQDNFIEIFNNNNNEEIFSYILKRFEGYIKLNDYSSILKVFNHKGIIAHSRVGENCGLLSRQYIPFVKRILKEKDEVGETLVSIMKKYIPI